MERTKQWKSTTESITGWYIVDIYCWYIVLILFFSNVHKPSSSLLNIVVTSFLGSFNDASRKNRCERFPVVERLSQTAKRSMAAFYILFGCRSESLFGCLTFNGNERLVLGHLLQRQRWSFLKAQGSDSTEISPVPERPLTSCIQYYYCHRYHCASDAPFRHTRI